MTMTSGTVVETKLKKLDHGNDVNNYSATTHKTSEDPRHEAISPFYDETIPKDDPKFLAPIRKWEKQMGFVTAIRWDNVFFISLLHLIATLAPIYVFWIKSIKTETFLLQALIGQIGGFGVTGGAHRYWTHRSYEAKIPFQIILLFSYAVAAQNTIFEWVRDHRVHHKMSETSADPHDVRRGFFFSHVGWLMMKKHPHVIKEGKDIYLDDILKDPLIRIYTKYFTLLKLMCCIILPTVIPVYGWNEEWDISFLASIVRYTLNLNFTWSVNSFAHIWGNKPYDENIKPVENWGVSMVAMGEGWHNYHHTFPWDYKAAELSYFINTTTLILDGFALIGLVYNRKQASPSTIKSVMEKRGAKLVENH